MSASDRSLSMTLRACTPHLSTLFRILTMGWFSSTLDTKETWTLLYCATWSRQYVVSQEWFFLFWSSSSPLAGLEFPIRRLWRTVTSSVDSYTDLLDSRLQRISITFTSLASCVSSDRIAGKSPSCLEPDLATSIFVLSRGRNCRA